MSAYGGARTDDRLMTLTDVRAVTRRRVVARRAGDEARTLGGASAITRT